MITLEEFRKRYNYDSETDKLGMGGSALVIRAWDTKLDRIVALKVFTTEAFGRSSLEKEIGRAMKIDHPNVLRYFDLYEVLMPDGKVLQYGVMEYADGGDLEKWLTKPQQDADKVRMAWGILKGIQCLHDLGWVHRDLKPGNILLVDRGGEWVPKIGDFGLTREKFSSKTTQSHTVGTIGYMAPETLFPDRFADSSRYDQTLDIWALGIILFELFVGTHPFGAKQAKATLAEVTRAISLAEIPPTISLAPPDFQKVIRMCLVANPIEREREIDELFRRLTPVADSPATANVSAPKPEPRVYRAIPPAPPPHSIPPSGINSSKEPNPPKKEASTPPRGPVPIAPKVVTPEMAAKPSAHAVPPPPAQSGFLECPNCKNQYPQQKAVCPHCQFIVKGPLSLNYIKIGGQQAAAMILFSLFLALAIGAWEFGAIFEWNIAQASQTQALAAGVSGINWGVPNGTLTYILAGLAGFTLIAFLGWLIRARINLKHFGYKSINYGLPFRLLFLLLPIINLYFLADLLTETWLASSPRHIEPDSKEWKKEQKPVWVGFLSTVLFLNILGTSALLLLLFAELDLEGEWSAMAFWTSVSTFLLGWILLGIIMLGINWRQRRKITAMMHQKPYGKLSMAAQKGGRIR